jgi:hypothetical protein
MHELIILPVMIGCARLSLHLLFERERHVPMASSLLSFFIVLQLLPITKQLAESVCKSTALR